MICESLILIPLSYIYRDKVIFAFTLTIFTMNMMSYFKNLYQSIGEFKRYGQILNLTTITTFIVNMVLLFIFKTDDYFIYLLMYVLVDVVIWVKLELNAKLLIQNKNKLYFSPKLLIEDIKSGFLLMVGNFSNILLSSIDRWFVKIMMNSIQFAYYSFAVSIEGFLNVAVTPITTTLYNYFCNHQDVDDILKMRRFVIIFSSIIIALAFPAKFVIEIFLQNYIDSVKVIFILFASQMIDIIIKGIYVNLYKANKKQGVYFSRLILILIVGSIVNYLFVKIYPFKEAFAIGTLFCVIIWFIICINDFYDYKFNYNELLYIFFEIMIFLILGISFNDIFGLLIYMTLTIIMLFILMRNDLKELMIFIFNK